MCYTTEDILADGSCPVCGEIHCDWTPYMSPEDNEIGSLCPICYTHFVDIDNHTGSCEYFYD